MSNDEGLMRRCPQFGRVAEMVAVCNRLRAIADARFIGRDSYYTNVEPCAGSALLRFGKHGFARSSSVSATNKSAEQIQKFGLEHKKRGTQSGRQTGAGWHEAKPELNLSRRRVRRAAGLSELIYRANVSQLQSQDTSESEEPFIRRKGMLSSIRRARCKPTGNTFRLRWRKN